VRVGKLLQEDFINTPMKSYRLVAPHHKNGVSESAEARRIVAMVGNCLQAAQRLLLRHAGLPLRIFA
jgi:hypothetical protein